ncbi:MAG: hypothetical protein ACYCYP_13340, partial [Leptospirales bacterium]
RPALIRSLGGCDRSFQSEAIVQTAVEKKVGRMEFIRGIAENRENQIIVSPVGRQESHILSGLVQANCLIRLEEKLGKIPAMEKVTIEWLNW